jgi:hypothetical protein
MTQPQPRVLSEPERSEILRQVIATKVNSQGGLYGHVGAGGIVTARRTGPFVRKWGNTWAEVAFGNWRTHPAVIALHVLFSIMTCGFYLPRWFYRKFKKPPIQTLSIDEHGYEHWVQHEISQGQNIQRWVLLVVLVWWLWQIMQLLNAYGQMQT